MTVFNITVGKSGEKGIAGRCYDWHSGTGKNETYSSIISINSNIKIICEGGSYYMFVYCNFYIQIYYHTNCNVNYNHHICYLIYLSFLFFDNM